MAKISDNLSEPPPGGVGFVAVTVLEQHIKQRGAARIIFGGWRWGHGFTFSVGVVMVFLSPEAVGGIPGVSGHLWPGSSILRPFRPVSRSLPDIRKRLGAG